MSMGGHAAPDDPLHLGGVAREESRPLNLHPGSVREDSPYWGGALS